MTLENEILVRNSLESKLRNLQLDLDAANGHLEEESESKLELQRQLNRLQEEFRVTREKIEKENETKIEEIEDSKRKLNSRYMEIQDQLTETMSRFSSAEKMRVKLQAQVDVMTLDLEKVCCFENNLTKKFFFEFNNVIKLKYYRQEKELTRRQNMRNSWKKSWKSTNQS